MTMPTPDKTHSPLPWVVKGKDTPTEEWDGKLRMVADLDSVQIWTPEYVNGSYAQNRIDADFICLAVNSHAALVEAFKKIITQDDDDDFHDIWNPDSGPEVSFCKAQEIAKEALRQAGETV